MARNGDIEQAVALALSGDWDAAHAIAQRHEGEEAADWLHAVLHRIEGDLANARYWYGRCGRRPDAFEATDAELAAIRESLTT